MSDSTGSRSYKSFLAGSVAGISGLVLSHPFDTARIRYQTDGKFRYKGVFDLYKGMGPPLGGVIAEKTIVFGTYEETRRRLTDKIQSPFLRNTVAGLTAGAACSVIVTPVDRIKINLQDKNRTTKTTFSTIRNMYRVGGISSLYKGYTSTLWREVPGYGLYLSLYQHIKDTTFDGKLNPTTSFLTAASVRCLVWTIIYPADAIKTRLQSSKTNSQYKGNIDTLYHVIKTGGIRSLYSGFSMALLRAVPLHAGVILGYESSLSLLQ